MCAATHSCGCVRAFLEVTQTHIRIENLAASLLSVIISRTNSSEKIRLVSCSTESWHSSPGLYKMLQNSQLLAITEWCMVSSQGNRLQGVKSCEICSALTTRWMFIKICNQKAGQMCILLLSEALVKCSQQWQYCSDFCNHFEVIMLECAECAPWGGKQKTFCSVTVWSQIPSGTQQALQQLSVKEKLQLDIKYGHCRLFCVQYYTL